MTLEELKKMLGYGGSPETVNATTIPKQAAEWSSPSMRASGPQTTALTTRRALQTVTGNQGFPPYAKPAATVASRISGLSRFAGPIGYGVTVGYMGGNALRQMIESEKYRGFDGTSPVNAQDLAKFAEQKIFGPKSGMYGFQQQYNALPGVVPNGAYPGAPASGQSEAQRQLAEMTLQYNQRIGRLESPQSVMNRTGSVDGVVGNENSESVPMGGFIGNGNQLNRKGIFASNPPMVMISGNDPESVALREAATRGGGAFDQYGNRIQLRNDSEVGGPVNYGATGIAALIKANGDPASHDRFDYSRTNAFHPGGVNKNAQAAYDAQLRQFAEAGKRRASEERQSQQTINSNYINKVKTATDINALEQKAQPTVQEQARRQAYITAATEGVKMSIQNGANIQSAEVQKVRSMLESNKALFNKLPKKVQETAGAGHSKDNPLSILADGFVSTNAELKRQNQPQMKLEDFVAWLNSSEG